MKKNFLSLYEKNHIIKNDERFGLINEINKKYNIKKVLYPGSYAHITPIFVFPLVIFNNVYKKLQDYYVSEEIKNYINKRKIYSDQPTIHIYADYNKSWCCGLSCSFSITLIFLSIIIYNFPFLP